MKPNELEKIINEAFENKQSVSESSDKKILDAIKEAIELTDKGNLRVAEKKNGKWSVNQWVKKETGNRVSLYSVECRENEKNSAIFIRPEASSSQK